MFLTLTAHDDDARSLQETVVDESVCADLAGVIRAGFVVAHAREAARLDRRPVGTWGDLGRDQPGAVAAVRIAGGTGCSGSQQGAGDKCGADGGGDECLHVCCVLSGGCLAWANLPRNYASATTQRTDTR